MNITKRLSAALLLFTVVNSYAQEGGKLQIVRGKVDTVYSASHIVVGVTEPNKNITINNTPVKQYKTGTFGQQLDLKPGDNSVEIKVLPNNLTESFNVYYSTTPKKSKPAMSNKENELEIKPIDKVVTTKEGAYLNFGNGTDRLGGAKINFLDKGIKLQVVGENKNLYKVQLSENRYSFIPKSVVESEIPLVAVTSQKQPIKYKYNSIEPALSESISITNKGSYDRVYLTLSDKRPYIINYEINPGKVVIDLFNVQSNTNWITQRGPYGAVESIETMGIDSDVTRLIINLKSKSHWGYSVEYSGNSLMVDIKHTPTLSLKGLTFGVDAGHGGKYSGARGASGSLEKDQTLAMALTLKELLEREGAKVILSRDSDNYVNNSERVEKFKEANIDMLISVHCNAGGSPLTTGGTSTYYKHIEHRELANKVLARILEIDGVKNFGLIGNFNFALNAPTEFPSVLVETLFISNLWDEEHITDPAFQKQMMEKVVTGVKDYLKYCKKLEKSK